MRINKLDLIDFRNLERQSINPDPGINVIYGENGQGKTNLLEAIGLFNGMRSFRGARTAQLVRIGAEFSRLDMDFFSEERDQTARLIITADGKEASINSVKQPAASALMGKFCTVIFSPDRMSLISGGAGERRRFLDAAISQSAPRFAALVVEFNRVLAQRNKLLKETGANPYAAETLGVWDSALSRLGGAVAQRRAQFVLELSPAAEKIYEGISSGREPMELSYKCSFSSGGDYCGDYMQCLEESRQSDIKAGFTQHGPQRDDLDILIDGRAARAFGSQGQKRSAVLSLKLAEAGLLSELIGEQPVALLDDVMSELDAGRQEYLLNKLSGWQVFITCCDPGPLRLMDKGAVFEICGGKIK